MPDNRENPDKLSFSIESTTMRLKSLKQRRAEAADKELEQQLREPARDPEPSEQSGPAGRVRHDERGMAVWDWAAASGEVAGLSATNVMRKLEVTGLSIEETLRSVKALEPPAVGRDQGIDPYNTRRDPIDPFKKMPVRANTAPSGNPYDQGAGMHRPAPPVKRPPAATPAPAPAKNPRGSVLDQLLGKKK
jgi:hypothetical protein